MVHWPIGIQSIGQYLDPTDVTTHYHSPQSRPYLWIVHTCITCIDVMPCHVFLSNVSPIFMYYSLLIICHCPFTYYMLHFLTTRIIYICNIATMALRAKFLRKHCWQFCLCIAMCSKSVNIENVIISRHWAERRVDIWLFDIQMPFHIWICIWML